MSEQPSHSAQLADPGTFAPHKDDLVSRDPLGYPGYRDALSRASEKAGTDESVTTGRARINGHDVELALFHFAFMGGSMGEVAGERLTRALERAAKRGVPLVLRTETGGARMQEGMRSLIQMPKVVAARLILAEAHQPFVALLGHPTTGGVLASLASLADLTIAVEEATIGFAGPRVAERVTGQRLPAGSHTASFALDNGMVDAVVDDGEARTFIGHALDCLAPDDPAPSPDVPAMAESARSADAWEAVQQARKEKEFAFEFDYRVELRGDRAGHPAGDLGSGLVRHRGRRLLLLDTAGAPLWPAGFRKAMRCLDLASRLNIPIVTLVDTPGADPSADSEKQGVARLIAELTAKMLAAPVPILSIITGEGGSGGALAFATADRLLAYETSVFSVIGPEAAAEILWKNASRAPEASRLMKLTAHDLRELGIADDVLEGAPSGASLEQAVTYHLDRMPTHGGLAERRRDRWRKTW